MKRKINKYALIFVLCALVMALGLGGFAMAFEPVITTIKVGLNYGSGGENAQASYITLENSTGFKVGQFNADRSFAETDALGVTAITVASGSGGIMITDNASGQTYSFSASKLAVVPAAETAQGTAYTSPGKSGLSYYGGFEFTVSGSVLTVVNYVDIEDYVKCVVPYEVSASAWGAEALKAQAVCARTYAMYNVNRYPARGFDVYNTASSQVYGGVYTDASYKNRVNDAVDSTAGEYILYNGSLIEAVYHAASGGATEDAANVWDGAVPYLKGVADKYEKTPAAYSFNGIFTANEIYTAVKAKNPGFSLADIADISCVYTAMGNMYSIKFTDSLGKSETYYKSDCWTRILACFTSYTSQRFTITKEAPEGGSPGGEKYAIKSSGYGHNVGMSQYGAKGMADAGFTYDEIIKYYYAGVTLSSGEPKPLFTDVKVGDWHYGAVMFAAENGLFQGIGGNVFSPNTPMERCMFVTVLGRALGIDPGAYGSKNTFPDVPAGQYYTGYVAWAAEDGIVEGYDDGTFRPKQTITREEMCALFHRFSDKYGITLDTDAATPAFLDSADISRWAVANVDAMRLAKVVQGDNGYFYPKKPCTRAEVAQVFMNFLSRYPVK